MLDERRPAAGREDLGEDRSVGPERAVAGLGRLTNESHANNHPRVYEVNR